MTPADLMRALGLKQPGNLRAGCVLGCNSPPFLLQAGKPEFASDHDTNIVRPLQAGKGPEFEGDHDTNPVRAMESPATGPK